MICTKVIEGSKDYLSAIKMTCDILEEQGVINKNYYDAILNNIKKYGGYFYIGKEICMPHARTEDGALKSGMCVLTVKNAVTFFQHKIKIFITIAVKDEEEHLKNLHKIVAFCSDEEKMKRVQEIDDERQIRSVCVW